MPFGSRNAAQTFQRFINGILNDLDFCETCVDDILVASQSEAEHIEHLNISFTRLQKFNVVINPDKCVLGLNQVSFLELLDLLSLDNSDPTNNDGISEHY